jgi:hypothetical protein
MVVDKDVADTANLTWISSRTYVEVVMSKGAELQKLTRVSERPQPIAYQNTTPRKPLSLLCFAQYAAPLRGPG